MERARETSLIIVLAFTFLSPRRRQLRLPDGTLRPGLSHALAAICSMSADAAKALRELRDALRQPIDTVDDFTFLLSSTLQQLNLHPTSTASASSTFILRALEKQLPSVQQDLLSTAVPTFLHALDSKTKGLLDCFFCPFANEQQAHPAAARAVALCSYTTLPALLCAKTGVTPMPDASRGYVLEVLGGLAEGYGVRELHAGVWEDGEGHGESSKAGDMRRMRWEEAVKAVTSLPAKVANAVGSWKAEGWKGEVPDNLAPRRVQRTAVVSADG